MDKVTVSLAVIVCGGVFAGAMWLMPPTKASADKAPTDPATASAAPVENAVPLPQAPNGPTPGAPTLQSAAPDAPMPDAPAASPAKGAFAPGQWQLTSNPGSGTPEDGLTAQKCLSTGDAAMPAKQAVLTLISRNNCTSDAAMISGGTISGTLTCPGAGDIPEHPEHLSGRYDANSIHVTIDMPYAGNTAHQTIDYQHTGACPAVAPPTQNRVRITQ